MDAVEMIYNERVAMSCLGEGTFRSGQVVELQATSEGLEGDALEELPCPLLEWNLELCQIAGVESSYLDKVERKA